MSASALSTTDKPHSDHFHPDDEVLAQYASVSRASVLALVLGLASALALVSALLVVVPLAAIATAAVALRQIATSEGRLLGTWPATAGLCLATLFLGWGLSREFTREAELAQQAQEFADGWLLLVRDGQLQKADQMTRTAASRLHDDAAIAEFYASDKEAGDAVRAMYGRDLMQGFAGAGPAARFQLASVVHHQRLGFTDEITLTYTLTPIEGPPRTLWLTVERSIDPMNKLPGWRINRADGEPPAVLSR
jgi:hypothetical protein